MDIAVKNFKIGVAAIIACYLAFIFYLLTLFFSIEVFGKDNMLYSFILAGFLAAFVLASGILFLVSLVVNIRMSKTAHRISKGLILTLIGIPPIVLCYLAFAVKALTEWWLPFGMKWKVFHLAGRTDEYITAHIYKTLKEHAFKNKWCYCKKNIVLCSVICYVR